MDWTTFKSGDLVWFDPNNNGFHIPGEIQEVHHAAQVLTVDAVIDGKVSFHTFIFIFPSTTYYVTIYNIIL